MQLTTASRIYVAGTAVGGFGVVRALRQQGHTNLVLRTHHELDLTNQLAFASFFAAERPEAVIMAAARVGGIHANNSQPALFIRDNLRFKTTSSTQLIARSREIRLFGSSCIYPKLAPQPIKEDYLLTVPSSRPTNGTPSRRCAGVKMCQAYRREFRIQRDSLMPTNLYGPATTSICRIRMCSALIRRFHEAKVRGDESVTVWGTGTPRREFLHVDDLADAVLYCYGLMMRGDRPILAG